MRLASACRTDRLHACTFRFRTLDIICVIKPDIAENVSPFHTVCKTVRAELLKQAKFSDHRQQCVGVRLAEEDSEDNNLRFHHNFVSQI
jgi:hypothetical protein